jgi:tRNA (guanine37-N1)-methyltransferase
MVFHFITIFPEALRSYFDTSILKRAQKNNLLKIKFYNPRDFAKNKHKKVDDKPFGGGPGMVMKIEPIIKTIRTIRTPRTKIIMLSPAGKQFTQKMAQDWAKKYKNIILISGRYEGIDERVKKILKAQEISVGPYILTGGELAGGIIIDAVSRHIPGVLGKKESLEEERGIGIPVYTRPEVFEYRGKKYRAPKVLLSGNHKKIEEWRKKHKKI